MSENQQHSQRAHAVLSASGSHRWMNCPGSIKFAKQFPPSPTTDAAEEGTAAHELSEKVLLNPPNAYWYIGREKFNGYDVDEEMAEHVQMYCDHVIDVRNELEGKLSVEERFDISWLYPGMFGTNDACIRQEFGKLVIIDFKYGIVPVEVEENSQLIYYAIGAAKDGDYSEIELHIVQPRAPHPQGPIRIYKMSPEDLVRWQKKLKQAAIETEKEAAKLNAGAWCNYCPCAGSCPTYKKRALEIAQVEFDDQTKLPTVEKLTDQQIVKIIEHKKFLEKFIEEVQSHAKSRLENGEAIEGLKLVRGRGRRDWSDKESAEFFLQEKLGENAFQRKFLSVAQAEKLLGKKEIADHWCNIQGGVQVAHESDKRAAISGTVESDFEIIEGEENNSKNKSKEEITGDIF